MALEIEEQEEGRIKAFFNILMLNKYQTKVPSVVYWKNLNGQFNFNSLQHATTKNIKVKKSFVSPRKIALKILSKLIK